MTLRLKDREQQAWLDKMTRSMFAEARNAFMEDAEQIKFDINDKAIPEIEFKIEWQLKRIKEEEEERARC